MTPFIVTTEKQPHGWRAKEILKKHPDIRAWMNRKNPWGFLIIIAAVSFQTLVAASLSSRTWWEALLLAFFMGTIANHTCIALIHECSHSLLFKSKFWNMAAGLLVNIHMFIPSAISFKKYHLKHHSQMGLYDKDADLPSKLEAQCVKNTWYRKFIWLLFFPLWQSLRTGRVKSVRFFDRWVVANIILTISFDYLIYYFFGPISLLYLAASMWFGFGFSVVGGRIIQEHFLFREGQETYSYYGALSFLSLHVGHHNEHHDFPTVPWNYLPKIRKLSPELYNNFYYHTSWAKLVIRFIFDNKVFLSDRIVRDPANQEVDINFQ